MHLFGRICRNPQHVLAAKIAQASARVEPLTAEVAHAAHLTATAFAAAEAARQVVIAITEEIHPSERTTMGRDPDRVRRYNQACATNGEAAAALNAAKGRHADVSRQRTTANGDLQLMIERVVARARRDTTP